MDTTALVVVCGSVDPKLTSTLMKFLLSGGQLLCLCSDLLYSVLHTFTTAEVLLHLFFLFPSDRWWIPQVREHELVRFTYGKWSNVRMMHHIFCYQASPARKQFSKDSDASNHSSGNGSSPIAPRTPSTVELQHGGKNYTVQVQVLGAEETWQTPSLLLATVKGSEGRAVFSQVMFYLKCHFRCSHFFFLKLKIIKKQQDTTDYYHSCHSRYDKHNITEKPLFLSTNTLNPMKTKNKQTKPKNHFGYDLFVPSFLPF